MTFTIVTLRDTEGPELKTIYVPTINDGTEVDFDRLFCLWNEANSCVSDHVLEQLVGNRGNNLDISHWAVMPDLIRIQGLNSGFPPARE